MGESIKAVCALLMGVGSIVAVLAWTADHPNSVTWGLRIGGPVVCVLSLILILTLQLRTDLERDYLRHVTAAYFNRDGFCFAFVVTACDGIAFMDTYFQSQYDKPSHGRIALRPARGFFMVRTKFDTLTFDVECPPGGFGYIRMPIPIPEKRQGKRQSFEVGASVQYADGKGRRIRFHDGIFLRSDSNFGNSFATAVAIAGAATGSIVLTKPAKTSIQLPVDVAEHVPDHIPTETRTLWQIGDPALEGLP